MSPADQNPDKEEHQMREKNWYLDLGNKKQRRKGKNKKIDPRKNKRKTSNAVCEIRKDIIIWKR